MDRKYAVWSDLKIRLMNRVQHLKEFQTCCDCIVLLRIDKAIDQRMAFINELRWPLERKKYIINTLSFTADLVIVQRTF